MKKRSLGHSTDYIHSWICYTCYNCASVLDYPSQQLLTWSTYEFALYSRLLHLDQIWSWRESHNQHRLCHRNSVRHRDRWSVLDRGADRTLSKTYASPLKSLHLPINTCFHIIQHAEPTKKIP